MALYNSLLQPQNREVGQKLGVATALMCVLPVASFYLAHYWWEGNDMYAGAVAVLVTNCIVAGYAYAAYREDRDEIKNKPPQVGFYKKKERTD